MVPLNRGRIGVENVLNDSSQMDSEVTTSVHL